MGHRVDHVERHQGLQRVCARLDERRHVLADETAFPDVDERFGGPSLQRAQLVVPCDGVEVACGDRVPLGEPAGVTVVAAAVTATKVPAPVSAPTTRTSSEVRTPWARARRVRDNAWGAILWERFNEASARAWCCSLRVTVKLSVETTRI